MKKQRFKTGDRILHRETSKLGKIAGFKHLQITSRDVIDGESLPFIIHQENWRYRLEGDGLSPTRWFPEIELDSVQSCPNCQESGWDWVTGCDRCGLSPEDAN